MNLTSATDRNKLGRNRVILVVELNRFTYQ